jgi:Na+/glutamate symporter
MRIFLVVSALAWGGYGLYCLINPAILAELAGVTAVSATATTELRAMYGGVQTALGVFAALAVVNAGLQRPALLALAFATGGLFTARLIGALLASDLSSYTVGALVFESVYTVIAIVLLRRSAHNPG